MTFYNRNNILYIRINGQRRSTFLEDTAKNRKLVMSYYKNDEFFKKFDLNRNVPTVLELCDEVLEEKEEVLKASSISAYNSLYNSKIVPFFQKMLISEVRPKHIEKWYKTFKDRSSLTTSETILKCAIEKAVLREYIISTPLILSRPRFKSNYELNPFTLEEINILLSKASRWFKVFIGINFFTGMRTGELLALKWSDIDFNSYTINIERTVSNGRMQTPKTKASVRVIDMLPQCENLLREQRLISGLSEFIFPSNKSKHFYSSASLNNIWYKLLRNCKLEERGIYQLRHSFASNMLSNGEELLWVSSMLGHKSGNITLEKYIRFIRKKRERKNTFFDEVDTKVAH